MPIVSPKISSTACIISITRLLKHFDDTSCQKFKQLLLQELKYTNEAELWCKALLLLSKSMTDDSLSRIKKEIIIIGDQQPSINNNAISVWQEIQQKYKDRLSNLHSDIIDHLGTFLDKKQSIEFGYLNRQIYIETQKQSYLLKRCNDTPFIINDKMEKKFFSPQTSTFAYNFPKQLEIKVKSNNKNQAFEMQDSQWYQNAFYILNRFKCDENGFKYLEAIPIEQLFCKNGNNRFFKESGRLEQIEQFELEASLSLTRKFCDSFDMYYTRYCDNNIDKIRNITQFIIGSTFFRGKNTDIRRLVTLGQISHKINLSNCKVCFNDINHVKQVFHKKLKVLECNQFTTCRFEQKLGTTDNIAINMSDCGLNGLEISINIYYNCECSNPIIIFNQLGLRCRIHCFTVSLHKEIHKYDELSPMFDGIFNIFTSSTANYSVNIDNKIETCKNQTLTVKILRESQNLYNFAEVLLFLRNRRCKILNSNIHNIQSIICEFCLTRIRDKIKINRGSWSGSMWRYHANIEYSIDKNKIECKICDLSEKELGILYQNMIKWFQNIQNQYGNDKFHNQSFFLHLKLSNV